MAGHSEISVSEEQIGNLIQLAAIQSTYGNFQKAQRILWLANWFAPKNVNVLMAMAKVHLSLGLYSKATELLTDLYLDMDVDKDLVWQMIGRAALCEGNKDDARFSFGQIDQDNLPEGALTQ